VEWKISIGLLVCGRFLQDSRCQIYNNWLSFVEYITKQFRCVFMRHSVYAIAETNWPVIVVDSSSTIIVIAGAGSAQRWNWNFSVLPPPTDRQLSRSHHAVCDHCSLHDDPRVMYTELWALKPPAYVNADMTWIAIFFVNRLNVQFPDHLFFFVFVPKLVFLYRLQNVLTTSKWQCIKFVSLCLLIWKASSSSL